MALGVLHCNCLALFCTILHCMCCTVLYCFALFCTILHCVSVQCWYCIVRRWRALDALLTSRHTSSTSKFAKPGRNPTKKRNPAKMRNPRKMSKSGRTEMRPGPTAAAGIWAIWATFWLLILPVSVAVGGQHLLTKFFLVDFGAKNCSQLIAFNFNSKFQRFILTLRKYSLELGKV